MLRRARAAPSAPARRSRAARSCRLRWRSLMLGGAASTWVARWQDKVPWQAPNGCRYTASVLPLHTDRLHTHVLRLHVGSPGEAGGSCKIAGPMGSWTKVALHGVTWHRKTRPMAQWAFVGATSNSPAVQSGDSATFWVPPAPRPSGRDRAARKRSASRLPSVLGTPELPAELGASPSSARRQSALAR